MKKTLLLSALAVAATMTAGAKTADELRVYINPGHGSYTPNDRPNPIVGHGAYSRTNTDTTNFFESNTNLRKGFGVLERLIDYGLKFDRTKNQTGERWQIGAARDMENNIVMSHVKCGPYNEDNGTANQFKEAGKPVPENLYYYNRDLTEICKEVDSNNFDMFISIHSNATSTDGTTSNYPLYLYRGYDIPSADEYNKPSDGSEPIVILSNQHQVESRKMADLSWPYAIEDPFATWTSYLTSKNLRGDINFYGSSSTSSATYCKGYLGVLKHHVPGFLVEGYFHTYQPARHRAMNFDVSFQEGVRYAKGIADYFGLEKEKYGTIYGNVRDLREKFVHDYYKPNSKSNDIWLPINGCTVTLMKDGKAVAEYTTDNQYNGAFVFDKVEPGKYTVAVSHPDYKPVEPVEVEVSAAKVAYPYIQLENVNYVPPTKVYVDYPDPAATIAGINPVDQYVAADVYTDEPIAELEGKIVRRAIVQEGKMYILAVDKLPTYAQVVTDDQKPVPTILVYDLNEKKVLANVSTEGAYGSIQNVSDIQLTCDGYLLASNQTKTQYSTDYVENLPDGTKEPRGTFYIYKWANDENGLPTGAPVQWLSTTQSGRWFRAYAGPTFAYQGTIEEGQAIVPMPTITAPTYNHRWTALTVANGEQAAAADILQPASSPSEQAYGEGYRYITSPVNLNNFIAVTPNGAAHERRFVAEDKEEDLSTGNAELTGLPGTVGIFKYAGASYVVAPESKDGNNVGLRLINITDNIAKAVNTPIVGTNIPAAEVSNIATAGEVGYVYDDLNNVYTSAWIDLYVLRDGKISKITTKDVKQPVYKAALAYGLKAENTENGIEITYSLSDNATAATLVLTPAEGAVYTAALDNTKGQHTFTIDKAELEPDAQYAWEVKVKPIANASADELLTMTPPAAVRGSVITFTDPEYDTYGYTVIGHNGQYGFEIYNPAGELVAKDVHKGHALLGSGSNQSNPLRGAEHMGHALVASWGDDAHGVTAFNPLDLSEDMYSVFEGEMASSGLISYNGVGIGSGTPCVAIQGKGEGARLFTFDEDLLKNHVAVYNIGNNRTIKEAPADWGLQAMNNTNVEIAPVKNGVFLSQVRADFMDSGSPSIRYLDNNGKWKWDACDAKWPADMIGNCGSGIAVNSDETLFAVAGYSGIYVFQLSFNDDNEPVFTPHASMKVPTTAWNTLRFDAANNIHYYGRGDGYHLFAIPQSGMISTPGKEVFSITTGVEDVAVDAVEAEGEAVYYNMNGIQVPAENLVPGVYVKVVGKTSTKVVVK